MSGSNWEGSHWSLTTKRNSHYDLVELAMDNHTYIDIPRISAQGSQLFPDNHNDEPSNTSNTQNGLTISGNAQPFNTEKQSRSPQDYMAPLVPEDPTKTIIRAKKGDMDTQLSLVDLYWEGHGLPQDLKVAVSWYWKAAKQGYPLAKLRVGLLCLSGQAVKKDSKKAMKWLLRAVSGGLVVAQHNVRALYYDGLGVSKDHAKAIEWFLRVLVQSQFFS
ncbi:hypothetical protein BGX33_011405 [Mortierella sp. NVP41]|nr:hypothetical protein BGX33_011405 [Mortierella sp. NVP41]